MRKKTYFVEIFLVSTFLIMIFSKVYLHDQKSSSQKTSHQGVNNYLYLNLFFMQIYNLIRSKYDKTTYVPISGFLLGKWKSNQKFLFSSRRFDPVLNIFNLACGSVNHSKLGRKVLSRIKIPVLTFIYPKNPDIDT